MKKTVLFFGCWSLLLFTQCSKNSFEPELKYGSLSIKTTVDSRVRLKAELAVDNYLAEVKGVSNQSYTYSSDVKTLSSNGLELEPGSYEISVISANEELPAFGKPVYGAKAAFSIQAGETRSVSLLCLQVNSGVKVEYSDVLKSYCTQNGIAFSTTILQDEKSLDYTADENRVGYFDPGSITATLKLGEKEFSSRFMLAAQDLLTITFDLTESSSGALSLTVTGRDDVNTRTETVVINPNNPQTAESIVLEEDFSSITTGNSTTSTGSSSAWDGNESFIDVSTVYKAGGAVKLGGGSSGGYISSKPLNLSANGGKVSVVLKVKGWATVESELIVQVGNISKAVTYSAVMANSFEEVTIVFPSAGSASCTVKIASVSKRLFIDNAKVIN